MNLHWSYNVNTLPMMLINLPCAPCSQHCESMANRFFLTPPTWTYLLPTQKLIRLPKRKVLSLNSRNWLRLVINYGIRNCGDSTKMLGRKRSLKRTPSSRPHRCRRPLRRRSTGIDISPMFLGCRTRLDNMLRGIDDRRSGS